MKSEMLGSKLFCNMLTFQMKLRQSKFVYPPPHVFRSRMLARTRLARSVEKALTWQSKTAYKASAMTTPFKPKLLFAVPTTET
jgi:hypothetical protein